MRELQIATDAARELGGHGIAELHYITAEFEPFSSGGRPDLLFRPYLGPSQERLFVFVELRMPVETNRSLPSLSNLKEHREFAQVGPHDRLYFALATSREIDETVRSEISAEGIEVFDGIESGADLAKRILEKVNHYRESSKSPRRPKSYSPRILSLFPEETELPLAARSSEPPIQEERLEQPSVPKTEHILLPSLTDREVFNGVWDSPAFGRRSDELFGKLQRFFSEHYMGTFQENMEFLRFLKKTLGMHKYPSFDTHDLAAWFKEHRSGEEIGSKPRNKNRGR